MKKLLLMAVALGMVAASPKIGDQETRYMSRVYGPEKSFDVQVSTVMRTYTREHAYLPLIVQVHNWDAPEVEVSPGQFALRKSNGEEVYPISASEYLDNFKIQGRRNLKYLSRRGDNGIETKPGIWYIERSRFYPVQGKVGGVNNQIKLRPNFYMVDWLYFPQQEEGDYQLIYTGADGETYVLPVKL